MASTINASTTLGLVNSADTSGVLQLQTANTTALTVDASQNVGIGVTPSAWTAGGKNIEVGSAGNIIQGQASQIAIVQNATFNSGWKYSANGFASFALQTTGQHQFFTAPSGTAGNAITFTQAMTLDASGNLLVGGTSSVLGKLEVSVSDNSSTQDGINIRGTQNNAYGGYLSWSDTWNGDSYRGKIAAILGYREDVGKGQLRFFTYGSSALTERARIDSSGRFIVGGSNVNGRIQSLTPASYTESSFRADSATTASTNWNHFYGTSSSNSVANIIIYGNGNIVNANNSYGSLSDSKLKENIVDASPKLADLMQVQVRNYNFKSDPSHKQIGVVAQELEQVFPSMIDESPDRDAEGNDLGTTTKSVKYSVFVPMLIKAIQEQQAIIQQLQADVAALKGA